MNKHTTGNSDCLVESDDSGRGIVPIGLRLGTKLGESLIRLIHCLGLTKRPDVLKWFCHDLHITGPNAPFPSKEQALGHKGEGLEETLQLWSAQQKTIFFRLFFFFLFFKFWQFWWRNIMFLVFRKMYPMWSINSAQTQRDQRSPTSAACISTKVSIPWRCVTSTIIVLSYYRSFVRAPAAKHLFFTRALPGEVQKEKSVGTRYQSNSLPTSSASSRSLVFSSCCVPHIWFGALREAAW